MALHAIVLITLLPLAVSASGYHFGLSDDAAGVGQIPGPREESIPAPDPADVLARARDRALASADGMPRYLCRQTVERKLYRPEHPPRLAYCGQLGDLRRKPDWKLVLTTSDRLRFDVSASGASEIYSWAGANRFDDRGLFALVHDGALSTGSFSSWLWMVFRGDNPEFSFEGEKKENGRLLYEYGYAVPAQKSGYRYRMAHSQPAIAYTGTVLVDALTSDLVSLATQSVELPVGAQTCETDTTLRYSLVHIRDVDFFLPTQADLRVVSPDGSESQNRTTYSGCHEFVGESALTFDPAEPSYAAQPKTNGFRPPELPLQARFTLVLARNIDTFDAAAGDAITAKLKAPIRAPSGQVLVPAGTPASGRILKAEVDYFRLPLLTLTVRFTQFDLPGGPVPFTALCVSDAEERHPSWSSSRLKSRGLSLGSIDTVGERNAANYMFLQRASDRVTGQGAESHWLVVAP